MTVIDDRRLLVLFDADCGICSRSARVLRRLDRGRGLRLVPLQAAGDIPDAPPLDALLEAIHVRVRRGGWAAGGAAWMEIAREVPLLRPVAIAAGIPAVRRVVKWTYDRVAGNRHRLSRWLGAEACAVPPRTQ